MLCVISFDYPKMWTKRVLRFALIRFHVHGIPGSHTLLRLQAGQEPSEEDVQFAANLAAYFSRARGSTQSLVDCVSPKYVRSRLSQQFVPERPVRNGAVTLLKASITIFRNRSLRTRVVRVELAFYGLTTTARSPDRSARSFKPDARRLQLALCKQKIKDGHADFVKRVQQLPTCLSIWVETA